MTDAGGTPDVTTGGAAENTRGDTRDAADRPDTARHGNDPLTLLADERTGLIRRIDLLEPEPWWPDGLTICSAEVSSPYRLLPWPADRVSTGTAFGDPGRAEMSAVGEAVERYCGNFVPAGLLRSSYRRLREPALDPARLALYGDAQHAEPGFPFTPFTADLEVLWTRGRDLRDGTPAWLPASLVYVNYFTPPRADEPPTNYAMLAGIAAGPSARAARTAALEEVIERDATVVWWAGELPARPVTGAGHPAAPLLPEAEPGWYRAAGASGSCRYRVVAIPTVFEVAVVGVLLDDPRTGIAVFGVAARPDPAEAVRKALAEAVTLRRYALGLIDPEGEIWAAAAAGVIDARIFKPHRADRRYADDYRGDFRDVVDLGCHSQLWLDPRMRAHLAPITACTDAIALADLPHVDGDVLDGYLERVAARGLDAYAADLTTPDIAAAGLSVARVIVPGAYSNAPAAFPFLGGHRLRDDPARLGLRAADRVNLVPLPHT
ncbi:YcaO-like family protein [Streptosporangium sp. NPDC023825]|uniref:YcaO-like family protein n=1 Tax=Streptosporangium sp. NPDC023825 TaxID=3154909 RepID=UPI003414B7B4